MKILKCSAFALLAAFAFISCNNEPATADDDTVIIKEEPTETGSTEEEGSSLEFNVDSDEEGNVDGNVSGKIDLDEK